MLAGRRVLVVDNEDTICTVVADCLEDWPGTEVDCAHDGVAGVKRLQANKFSLAIIDIMLPNLSGFEVAQVAVNDDTPVVMLSGHPEVTTKLALVDLPHLEKPFRMAELLRESQAAIASSGENLARVRASLARLKERAGALQAALEDSRRLLGENMEQSARAEGRAPK
jgi:DNA-binding response OmpR family regulator